MIQYMLRSEIRRNIILPMIAKNNDKIIKEEKYFINIGTKEIISISELINIICNISKKPSIIFDIQNEETFCKSSISHY